MLDSCHLWQEREITCTMSNSDITYKNDWSSEFGTTCVWIIETYLVIDGCVSSLTTIHELGSTRHDMSSGWDYGLGIMEMT